MAFNGAEMTRSTIGCSLSDLDPSLLTDLLQNDASWVDHRQGVTGVEFVHQLSSHFPSQPKWRVLTSCSVVQYHEMIFLLVSVSI